MGAQVEQEQRFVPTPVGDFVGVDVAEPRWAVRDVWPAAASGIIAGRPKDGKSTIASELAVSLWSGTDMFGLERFPVLQAPEPVLYVQQENSDRRVRRDLQLIMAARGLGRFEEEQPVAVGEAADGSPIYERHQTFVPEPLQAPAFYAGEHEVPRFDVLSHAGFDLASAEDMGWLAGRVRAGDYRYVFLDPLYMLAPTVTESGADTAELKAILLALTALGNETGAGVVVTHHMSDKGGGNEPSSLLGSTFLHGWYEAAILTRRSDAGVFHVKVDAQRDFGTTAQHTLDGLGVGSWGYAEAAQEKTDSLGREAPRVSEKEVRLSRLAVLLAADPGAADEALAAELGVSDRTIRNYRAELAERQAELSAATDGGEN